MNIYLIQIISHTLFSFINIPKVEVDFWCRLQIGTVVDWGGGVLLIYTSFGDFLCIPITFKTKIVMCIPP